MLYTRLATYSVLYACDKTHKIMINLSHIVYSLHVYQARESSKYNKSAVHVQMCF